jgi:hypothetical protein
MTTRKWVGAAILSSLGLVCFTSFTAAMVSFTGWLTVIGAYGFVALLILGLWLIL